MEEYLSNIAQVLRSTPDTLFVLVATPPNLDEPRNPRIERYNQGLQQLAGQEPNTVLADAYQPLWQHKANTLMGDGTHLTVEGHRLVADVVISALLAHRQADPDKKRQSSTPSSQG